MIFVYLMRECSYWDVMQSQEQRAEWLARRTSGSTERVLMTLSDGESVSVLPLWIAVWQTLKGGLARCGGLLSIRASQMHIAMHAEAFIL